LHAAYASGSVSNSPWRARPSAWAAVFVSSLGTACALDAGGLGATSAAFPAGDAGQYPAAPGGSVCDYGSAAPEGSAADLTRLARVVYFGGGAVLPAGSYRVRYDDGCLKYSGLEGWTVHNGVNAGLWLVGAQPSTRLARPPGTVGVLAGIDAFADFEACVTANRALPPLVFSHGGGPIGLFLDDDVYTDDVLGRSTPRYTLVRLAACP
jgi:hypothetical protein